MDIEVTDNEYCQYLINAFLDIFPNLKIIGGAAEPFYVAPTPITKATIYFRSNYPRSLLHEISHYCLAGERRRKIDDFGYWYSPCGRTEEEQHRFEIAEARPQGLEKTLCEILGLEFSPSLDDFSGRPPSISFTQQLEKAYQEMQMQPPPTAKRAIYGLKKAALAIPKQQHSRCALPSLLSGIKS